MTVGSPIEIVKYNPSTDTANLTYQISVGVESASWLDQRIGTALNSKVDINKSGLLDAIPALNKPAVINFLLAQYSATATGLLISGAGVAALAISGAGTIQGDSTALTLDYNITTTVASGVGVKLPVITPLRTITIINNGANALKIYPFLGDYIGTSAVNVAVTLAVGAKAVFYSKSDAVANTTTAVWRQLV